MSDTAQTSQTFAQALNQLLGFYEAEELQKCADGAQDLLDDPALPRYHRIKTLVLLAHCLDEYADILDCSWEAERLYLVARDAFPSGEDAPSNEALLELRTSLDELKKYLLDVAPGGDDADE